MRIAKSGETVELRYGKFFIDEEEVEIPQKAAVSIHGGKLKGWWRMTLAQAMNSPTADLQQQAPPFNLMTEFLVLVDCRDQKISQIELL